MPITRTTVSERLTKLKKLRGRSLNELRVRGAQGLAALAERRGWSEQTRVPADAEFFRLFDLADATRQTQTAETLLDDFRAHTHFFTAFNDHTTTIRT